MKRFTAIIIFMLTSTVNAWSQDSVSVASETVNIYITGQVGLPSPEFREVMQNSIGNMAVGLNIGLMISPFIDKKLCPVLVGLDFSYLNYGIDKIDGTSTIPPLKITYNVITWDAVIRFRPAKVRTAIVPFADGMIGVKLLNTITKVDQDVVSLNSNQSEVLDRVNNTGLNYGLGAGFTYRPKKDEEAGAGFYLRCLYVWGEDIKYVVRHSIVVDSNGYISYQTNTVNTSIFMIQLGINLKVINQIKIRR